MKLTITGGAGFIGSNLARRALERGHEVTILDDLSNGHLDNVPADARFLEASILDADAVDDAISGASSIIHLGGIGSVPRSLKQPERYLQVNAGGTLSLLEAARRCGVGHLVFSSSSSVYGANPALPKHEREWVRPMSPYAVSKLAAEQYVLAYQNSYGLNTLAFRFFNVYGPRQRPDHDYAAVIPIFLAALLRGQPLPINGDGSQSRDFTYVGTVCNVLLRAAEEGKGSPEPVNLAFGKRTSLMDLIAVMERASGRKAELLHREPRVGDVPHSLADNTRLRELFPGLEPVSLEQGIQETMTYIKEWVERV